LRASLSLQSYQSRKEINQRVKNHLQRIYDAGDNCKQASSDSCTYMQLIFFGGVTFHICTFSLLLLLYLNIGLQLQTLHRSRQNRPSHRVYTNIFLSITLSKESNSWEMGSLKEAVSYGIAIYPDALREGHTSPRWQRSRAEMANLHLTQETEESL